jgi:hypothetical protein
MFIFALSLVNEIADETVLYFLKFSEMVKKIGNLEDVNLPFDELKTLDMSF